MSERQSFTERVMQCFRERPNVWIDAHELQRIGGTFASRTRISEARKQFQVEGTGTIENRVRRMYRKAHREGCYGDMDCHRCPEPVPFSVSEYRFVPSSPVEGRDLQGHDVNGFSLR